MKTKVEINGYEISIEASEDGLISVKAERDEEVVEEFTLQPEEAQGEEGEESEEGEEGIKSFGEFGGEGEEDFDSEAEAAPSDEEEIPGEAGGDDDDDDEEEEGSSALESFQSFISKNK